MFALHGGLSGTFKLFHRTTRVLQLVCATVWTARQAVRSFTISTMTIEDAINVFNAASGCQQKRA
eukprot:m.29123 g.29123  ORF g.29123 m.29123 type:complete len:65 (+) comp13678_c0_seq2:98-292(+)